MLENENLVTEQVAENTEQTVEQSPKTYTEAEFNAKLDELLGKKIARREAKIRKEYERKYGDLEEVLKAGTGEEDVGKITDTFREFYTKKGIKMVEKPKYTESDIEVLAKADADEIIRNGYDEVVEEVDRLTQLGVANMTSREKAVFKALATHRQNAERSKELTEIGVTEDVYNSKEFKDFAGMFNANTPVRDIYDLYKAKTQPKKEIKPMGSMKNSITDNGTVKDFYTRDEALKFTKADFDKNPALFKAVEASMLKW
jgi:hypothetical protein